MRPGQVEQGGSGLPLTFELLAEIATGPTARVELCRVRAPAELAGRLVAVKRLHPHIAEDPQFYSMFVDEVWMTAAIQSPNVTSVVGWGTDAEGTYLAVELIEGVSLARLMKTVFETREAFTERMVVYLGTQICSGLSAAHGLRSGSGEHLKLVHRDLTPGNVLLGFDGRVLIADFGLAKAKQRVTKTLTGLLKGHPHYMAPEQATDQPLDARADLFSLGVVLFELFTGRPPWTGANELDVFRSMANDPPADLGALRPKLDRELIAVVERLLAKNPSDRFSHAEEVHSRLGYWLETHGYKDENKDTVARFVRRNAMRQMRWFERAVAGDFVAEATRAKSRLLGAKAKSAPRPVSPTSAAPDSMNLAVKAPLGAASSRRRAAARRLADEVTDVSDVGAPSQESGDWGEEVPTVVKPNAHLTDFKRKSAALAETTPGGRSPAPPPSQDDLDMDSLPSFLDDDSSESSENRQTKVQPNTLLEGGDANARSGGFGVGGPTPHDPLRGTTPPALVSLVGHEDLPTAKTRTRPPPEAGPLQKLPPPRRAETASRPPPEPKAAVEQPEVPAPGTETVTTARRGPRGTQKLPRTEADIVVEADRLQKVATKLRADADQAAKLAAHRAVLAQLAAEAVALVSEAARSVATKGEQHARALIEEAYRLEASIVRGETAGVDVGPASIPPAADRPVDAGAKPVFAGAAANGFGGPTPVPTNERPSYAPPPPAPTGAAIVASVQPDPRREGAIGARQTGGTPPATYGHSLVSSVGPAHAPPAEDLDPMPSMFAGEVWGVKVPYALMAAFVVAVGTVVLVWLIVS